MISFPCVKCGSPQAADEKTIHAKVRMCFPCWYNEGMIKPVEIRVSED